MDITTTVPLLAGSSTGQGRTGAADQAKAPDTDFQSFLVLLTAQLRNQDPLQPLDSTQFIAQLASFSTVEQLVGVNDRLDAQANNATLASGAEFASWIGRAVSAIDGRFTASGGPEAFSVPQIDGAERIEAVVFAADGREVDRFTVAADAEGRASWTGATALAIAPGSEMRIELTYHGSAGVIGTRPAPVFRTINGMRGSDTGPVFQLAGGGTLSPSDVAELRTASNQSAPNL